MSLSRVGILVGGGPAPGINGVISAAAIEAINRRLHVVGFYDGFQWLASKDFDPTKCTVGLNIQSVGRIHFDGGSILRAILSVFIARGRARLIVAYIGVAIGFGMAALDFPHFTTQVVLGLLLVYMASMEAIAARRSIM